MGAPVSDSFTSEIDSSVAQFAVEDDGTQEDVTANLSEESIPFGNYVVVQRGGGGPEHGTLKLYIPSKDQKDTLKNQARRGDIGTLRNFEHGRGDGDGIIVVLKSFQVTRWYHATDEWEGTLTYTANVS